MIFGGVFLCFAGGGRLYGGCGFSGRGHRCCYRAEMGMCPTTSVNDSSQGGVMYGNLSKAVIKGLGVEGWESRLTPQNRHYTILFARLIT
jgi:hypothetical protein